MDEATQALRMDRLGAARLLLETAQDLGIPQAAREMANLEELARGHRRVAQWGGPAVWLERHIGSLVPDPTNRPPPVLSWLLPESVRLALLRPLGLSTHPATMALMDCRQLQETTLLPPVSSASGQPLDAALLLGGALVESGRMHPMLMLEFERGATAAMKGLGSTGLEAGLLEMLAAARHLNWEQLASVMERCEDRASLQALVAAAGSDGAHWAPLFSAVSLNESARGVANFVREHGPAGVRDLRTAMGLGRGAVQELMRRGERIERSGLRRWVSDRLHLDGLSRWLARASGRAPFLSLCVKYLLWLDGLFLLILALWFGRHTVLEDVNQQFEPRPDYGRLAAVTLAAAVLLFLTAERLLVLRSDAPKSRAANALPVFHARLRFDIPQVRTSDMNEKVIAMLVAFLVIQFAIYVVGLGRLRHIRGQGVDGSVKLRLLDNEEPMFDAPLYIGIGGSVLALVMRLTGFDEVSLMASYSSTLFGILFCFVLKVVHVRPYRQRLILESVERKVA
jgi:hypothetical protein